MGRGAPLGSRGRSGELAVGELLLLPALGRRGGPGGPRGSHGRWHQALLGAVGLWLFPHEAPQTQSLMLRALTCHYGGSVPQLGRRQRG